MAINHVDDLNRALPVPATGRPGRQVDTQLSPHLPPDLPNRAMEARYHQHLLQLIGGDVHCLATMSAGEFTIERRSWFGHCLSGQEICPANALHACEPSSRNRAMINLPLIRQVSRMSDGSKDETGPRHGEGCSRLRRQAVRDAARRHLGNVYGWQDLVGDMPAEA
jgi:hypothetical protein